MCKHAGLPCGGYEKSIFFDFEVGVDSSNTRFRRPLLTEQERACMSTQLTTSVPPRLALWHIAQIDEQCEEAPPSKDIQVGYGPFGAFRIAQSSPDPLYSSPPSEPEDFSSSNIFEPSSDELLLSTGFELTPGTHQLFQTLLDRPETEESSSSMDVWNVSLPPDRIQEIYDDVDVTMPAMMPDIQGTPAITQPPFRQSYEDLMCVLQPTSCTSFPGMAPDPTLLVPDLGGNVPHDAVFLIKYYSTTVLKLLTPFRHSKSPWHVLFVPHSKSCLAALTLGDSMDHASLCAFFGTLAISAFSLGGVSHSSTWLDQGRAYKQHAREQARMMLRTAYDTPKTAKYKSILIALLTMVQLAIVSGDGEQTDCYFVEAEKFIRVKGLNRKKSRKVRLLHHCYAFERMFHESTFVHNINSAHRRHVRKAIESSGAVAYSHDSLSFRLGNWKDLDQDMLRIKGQEEGENDLHLELPGVWSATLYPEIFGVPEVYVFLLSLTIRLGEQKDDAEHQDPANALSLKEFLGRAKSVERCINQLRRDGQVVREWPSVQSSDLQQVVGDMLDAMQHALAIYFYRRIYDVDASMLQQRVVNVRDCLMRFDSAGPEMAYGSSRLIWPAFIAACEAEDSELRSSFSDWFNACEQSSGLRSFALAKAKIERIWDEKRNGNGANTTWLDRMKANAEIVLGY
jgi:arginine metabolism regulation protein II